MLYPSPFIYTSPSSRRPFRWHLNPAGDGLSWEGSSRGDVCFALGGHVLCVQHACRVDQRVSQWEEWISELVV